jgi:hypothetical protein
VGHVARMVEKWPPHSLLVRKAEGKKHYEDQDVDG